MEPRDLTVADMDLHVDSPAGISSPHGDPAVVMLDGSLHDLHPDMEPAVLRALLTIRGGEHLVPNRSGRWELLTSGAAAALLRPYIGEGSEAPADSRPGLPIVWQLREFGGRL
jgi:hypothetical protein